MDILIGKQFAALYEGLQNAEIDFLVRPFALAKKGGVFILFRKNIDFSLPFFFGIVAPPAAEGCLLYTSRENNAPQQAEKR